MTVPTIIAGQVKHIRTTVELINRRTTVEGGWVSVMYTQIQSDWVVAVVDFQPHGVTPNYMCTLMTRVHHDPGYFTDTPTIRRAQWASGFGHPVRSFVRFNYTATHLLQYSLLISHHLDLTHHDAEPQRTPSDF